MLHQSRIYGFVLAFVFWLVSMPAFAGMILVDFTWATTFTGQLNVDQGYNGSFSGSGTFTYDDTGTTGVDFEELGQWPNPVGSLLSLNLGGLNPIGTITFNATNSGIAGIFLYNGVLDSFVVYGLIDGAGITGQQDDFQFQFQLANGVRNPLPSNTYNVSVATATGAATSTLGSFTVQTQTVPEPSTLLLMATGLAGLGFASRKRKKYNY